MAERAVLKPNNEQKSATLAGTVEQRNRLEKVGPLEGDLLMRCCADNR